MWKTPQALLAIVVVVLAASLPRSAHAGSIPIVNYSFEDPVLPPSGFTGGVPGWSNAGANASNGVQNFSSGPAYPGGVPNGSNAAYVSTADTSIYQNLSSNLAAGTYTLTAYVGWRADDATAPTYDVQFGVNGGGGTVLADNSSVALIQGSFVPVSVTYTVMASNPYIGDVITVLLVNAAGSPQQVDFDDVTLNFTPTAVPEPASLVLMGIGGVAGLGYTLARRRAKLMA